MVCVYCGNATRVANSRLHKKLNRVWRRRQCATCGNVFTTHEMVDLPGSFVVRQANGKLIPFSRDKLLLSIYKSCAHRPLAIEDATALTATAVSNIFRENAANVSSEDLRKIVHHMLKSFDAAAAVHFAAYHQVKY